MGTPIGEVLDKKPLRLEELNHRRVGVDAFNVIYQFLSSIRGEDGRPLMDPSGRITSHVSGLFYRTTHWMAMGMQPVFVFDGPPHPLKSATREKRREIRAQASGELQQARESEDDRAIEKAAMQAVQLTPEIVEDAKKVLRLLGIPVVQAASEGEAQLAVMVEKGDLSFAISQDYDSLLFGMPRLVRNVALSGKRKVPGKNYSFTIEPEIIDLAENLNRLKITRKQLIWMGMLVGTDFNPKVPRVGIKTALKKVESATSVNDVFGDFHSTEAFDPLAVEQLFLHPPFSAAYDLTAASPDFDGLRSFLVRERDFSEERVHATLEKLHKSLAEKKSQTSLFQWV